MDLEKISASGGITSGPGLHTGGWNPGDPQSGGGDAWTGITGGFGVGTSGFEEEASDIIVHQICPPGQEWQGDPVQGGCGPIGGHDEPTEECSEYEIIWGLNGC
jgi:hypothetical protein